jgi:hypothetical protein
MMASCLDFRKDSNTADLREHWKVVLKVVSKDESMVDEKE